MKKWLFLMRGFFPSWRFFDVVGAELRLEARFGPSESDLGAWINCLPPISRSFQNISVNPHGNYRHACQSHLSHLSRDILASDTDHPESLVNGVTYKITQNLVRHQVSNLTSVPFFYQFRLCANREALLTSPLYKG